MSSDDLPIEKEKLSQAIVDLIDAEGLSLTAKRVRNHLKELFSVDLDSHRKAIDGITFNILEKKMRQPSDNSPKKKDDKPAASSKVSSDSDSDHGIASTARTSTKKLKRKSVAEIHDEEEEVDLMTSLKKRPRAAAKAASANLRKNAFRYQGKKEENNGKKKCPYNPKTKLCYISDTLQKITNQKYMRRCDVVASFWSYVRANSLADPNDKRYVLSDDLLFELLKKKRFLGFSVMKLIIRHVVPPTDLGPEYVKEAEDENKRLREKWLRENDDSENVVNEAEEDDDDDDSETKQVQNITNEDNGDSE